MRVAIVGSRGPKMPAAYDFIGPLTQEQAEHAARLEAVRRYVLSLPDDTTVVTGGAVGVDQAAMQAAKERTPRLRLEVYYPDWQQGRGAGLVRNRRIVHNSERLVAWWDGTSRGTKFTIDFAASLGREVLVMP